MHERSQRRRVVRVGVARPRRRRDDAPDQGPPGEERERDEEEGEEPAAVLGQPAGEGPQVEAGDEQALAGRMTSKNTSRTSAAPRARPSATAAAWRAPNGRPIATLRSSRGPRLADAAAEPGDERSRCADPDRPRRGCLIDRARRSRGAPRAACPAPAAREPVHEARGRRAVRRAPRARGRSPGARGQRLRARRGRRGVRRARGGDPRGEGAHPHLRVHVDGQGRSLGAHRAGDPRAAQGGHLPHRPRLVRVEALREVRLRPRPRAPPPGGRGGGQAPHAVAGSVPPEPPAHLRVRRPDRDGRRLRDLEELARRRRRREQWRDTACRLRGPVVRDLQIAFDASLQAARGIPSPPKPTSA